MPRTARASVGEICYHVINRGNARQQVFQKQGDYQALSVSKQACDREDVLETEAKSRMSPFPIPSFLILEFDQPFGAVIQIPSGPMRNALAHLGK